MLANLPTELVEMILNNLDAKSLSVCCLVSKMMNQIITGDVATKQLSRAINHSNTKLLLSWYQLQEIRRDHPDQSDLSILSNIESGYDELPMDQWRCHFLVKNASHYQIRYAEDYGDFGYYSRVYPDYDYTKPVTSYLAHANYSSLSDATKALAQITAEQDGLDSYYYPRALKISTSFDLIEYVADEINNSKVFVRHWSISLIE